MNRISKFIMLSLLITACSSSKRSSTAPTSSSEEVVYETTDSSLVSTEIPEHDMGVVRGLLTQVSYPIAAIENEVKGTVLLRFTVNAIGEVQDISVISERLGWGLEEEAIRVLKLTSGKWTPRGTVDKPVYYILPVKFELY